MHGQVKYRKSQCADNKRLARLTTERERQGGRERGRWKESEREIGEGVGGREREGGEKRDRERVGERESQREGGREIRRERGRERRD